MLTRLLLILSLLFSTGCYKRATVPSDALAVAEAMCDGNATAQPHPRVIRDNRGRTRVLSGARKDKGFIVDHKTQMRWNNDWVHVCYSGYDVRQVPQHDLRRPDPGKAIGVSIGLGLSAALIIAPIVFLSTF